MNTIRATTTPPPAGSEALRLAPQRFGDLAQRTDPVGLPRRLQLIALFDRPIASAKGDSRNLCSLISHSTFLQGFHDNLANVCSPLLERNPALGEKLVALVDGRNA